MPLSANTSASARLEPTCAYRSAPRLRMLTHEPSNEETRRRKLAVPQTVGVAVAITVVVDSIRIEVVDVVTVLVADVVSVAIETAVDVAKTVMVVRGAGTKVVELDAPTQLQADT